MAAALEDRIVREVGVWAHYAAHSRLKDYIIPSAARGLGNLCVRRCLARVWDKGSE